MAAEDIIEETVANIAEAQGWFQRKVHWGINRRGAPDRVFIKGGRTVWIEFKDDATPGLLQNREHRRMRDAGAELHVVDNIEDGLRILGLRDTREPRGLRR